MRVMLSPALVIMLMVFAQSQPVPPAKAKFIDDWRGKHVSLKRPLYSIAYESSRGVGVNMLSEERGRFFKSG